MLDGIQTALVLVAHPDDETLGLGATIFSLASEGCAVDVVAVTDGTSSQYPDNPTAQYRRTAHFHESCDRLGVRDQYILGLPDMQLDQTAHVSINNAVTDAVDLGQYEALFSHHLGDVNSDHRRVAETAAVLARPVPTASIRFVASFYVASSSEWGALAGATAFQPNTYVPVSEEAVRAKLDALRCYDDEVREFPHPRSFESIDVAARHFGAIVGVSRAEPLRLLWWMTR